MPSVMLHFLRMGRLTFDVKMTGDVLPAIKLFSFDTMRAEAIIYPVVLLIFSSDLLSG